MSTPSTPNKAEFTGHLPTIDEIAVANGLRAWAAQDADEQSLHAARLVLQDGLQIPLRIEGMVEGTVYGQRHKEGFLRGYAVGAVALESVGGLPNVSPPAAQLATKRYHALLDPSRRQEHADRRTPGLWGAIQNVSPGYVSAVDRFAKGEPQYPRNAFRRGAGFLFVIANEQLGLQFQNEPLRRQQMDAIKPEGLLDGFEEEQGLSVLHDLTENGWPWHAVLDRNKLAIVPISHLLLVKDITKDSESGAEDVGYLLGYTLCLELLEKHGALKDLSEKAAMGCKVFLKHEAKRPDAEKVESEKRDLLRSESEAFAAVLDHVEVHARDIPMEAVWNGAADAWTLILIQAGLENAKRLYAGHKYN